MLGNFIAGSSVILLRSHRDVAKWIVASFNTLLFAVQRWVAMTLWDRVSLSIPYSAEERRWRTRSHTFAPPGVYGTSTVATSPAQLVQARRPCARIVLMSTTTAEQWYESSGTRHASCRRLPGYPHPAGCTRLKNRRVHDSVTYHAVVRVGFERCRVNVRQVSVISAQHYEGIGLFPPIPAPTTHNVPRFVPRRREPENRPMDGCYPCRRTVPHEDPSHARQEVT